MPYNIKQLGEKSVSIDFFIADPILRLDIRKFQLLLLIANYKDK